MISIRRTIYRGKDGFLIVGTLPGNNKRIKIFTTNRKSAEHIRDLVKAGKDIDAKAFQKYEARMTEERDYKKEYAKFQSSSQKKKYRAELNKYNRSKGTYGNGDGKDASHKGGKISGYEAEGKNRGRREKSRLKGSKRKTEGVVMPTLREFIVQEAKVEIEERLSKRWNIVDSVGPSWGGEGDDGQSVVSISDIRRAAREGDVDYIKHVIQQVLRLRRKNGDDPESKDTLRKLLRIFIHIRKSNTVSESVTITEKGDASWGGPDVKASELQAKEIEPDPVPENLPVG